MSKKSQKVTESDKHCSNIFQVGTLVELRMRGGEAVYGVVKWRGQPHDWDEEEEAAGVELEEEMAGASNGWHMGTQGHNSVEENFQFGHQFDSVAYENYYRVTIQVVPYELLTSKQRLWFSTRSIILKRNFCFDVN